MIGFLTIMMYVGHLILLLYYLFLCGEKNGRSKSGARQFYLLTVRHGMGTHTVRTVHKYSIYRYVTKY